MAEKKVTKTTKGEKEVVKKEVVKKVTVKKEPVAKKAETKTVEKETKMNSGLTVDLFDNTGKKTGTIDLPEALFGTEVNKKLLSQAVRVYLTNQRQGNASTKTRGEVDGSTRKIYRQKGTGRARHGGIRAPIFVKGGIAHGPKPKNFELHMPTKMKRVALFSALSAKVLDSGIQVVKDLEKLEPKTKLYASLFQAMGHSDKCDILVVMAKDEKTVVKGARNLEGVCLTAAQRLNTHDVLKHKTVVLMEDAIASLQKTFLKETK